MPTDRYKVIPDGNAFRVFDTLYSETLPIRHRSERVATERAVTKSKDWATFLVRYPDANSRAIINSGAPLEEMLFRAFNPSRRRR